MSQFSGEFWFCGLFREWQSSAIFTDHFRFPFQYWRFANNRFSQKSVVSNSSRAVPASALFTAHYLRVGCLAQHMNSRWFVKLTACAGYVFGNLQRRQCVTPKAAHHLAVVALTPTARSLNKSVDISANFAASILSASNSKRLFKASAVKIESPWSQLASSVVN